MKKIIRFFSIATSFLLYKWLVVIINLIRRLCKARKNRKDDKREVPRRIRRATKSKCVPVRHPNYRKPDPMIYSQHYLMEQGLAVTWDNPDIQLYHKGSPVSSYSLQPGTIYEIVARCWNASYDAPVVGMPVIFSYLDFGAGAISIDIGQTFTSLGVIGGSDNPNFAKVLWKSPEVAGHYCIQAKLQWTDDKNPKNNLGQENANVVEAHSPAVFDFKVRNNDTKPHRYRVEADAYTIPTTLPCDEINKMGIRKNEIIRERNNRKNFPVPANWIIKYDEPVFPLAAEQERMVKVTVTPPENFVGSKPLNFNVFDERNVLTGGVTVTIVKK
jgi:hypothetical protein